MVQVLSVECSTEFDRSVILPKLEKETKSMKTILAAFAALALSATVAGAQEKVRVPTGYEVPGCARYTLTQSGQVRQDCTADTDPAKILNPSDPQSRVNNSGE